MPRFRWMNLRTRDVPAAEAFYTGLFGWRSVEVDRGAFKRIFEDGGAAVAGLGEITPWETGVPAHWLAFVDVVDLDATIEHARSLGGTLVWGPQELPDARFAVITDPTGATFGLWCER